jgi:hypothetical protein
MIYVRPELVEGLKSMSHLDYLTAIMVRQAHHERFNSQSLLQTTLIISAHTEHDKGHELSMTGL